MTLPKFGAPVVARWAFIAFSRSEHQAKARSGIAMRQLDEIEEERLAKEEAEKQKRLKEAANKVWEMRQVMKPQLRGVRMWGGEEREFRWFVERRSGEVKLLVGELGPAKKRWGAASPFDSWRGAT